jgi:predicted amino acid racemase
MAELTIHTTNIKSNISTLSDFFKKHEIKWSLITKVFSGDIDFLKQILSPDIINKIDTIGDSRLTSLKNLRTVNPEMKTIYIKPPAVVYAKDIVEYADVSLNSSLETIVALDEAAALIGKTHQVIIMIELGELREGVAEGDVQDFYDSIFRMKNIEVVGLGSNLGCMYGIEPTYEKLKHLCDIKAMIKRKFNRELPLISGGTSITLPLIEKGHVPKEINHFRIGEAAFFGISPLFNEQFLNLSQNTFTFEANIIELEEKGMVPDGKIGEANIGHTAGYEEYEEDETSFKGILDFGMLDVDRADITPIDKSLTFVGITSDMIVVDLGKNKTADGKVKYQVGDKISFTPTYMGVARLLNSKFIDKKFI